jgi:uncharacterized membrane protein
MPPRININKILLITGVLLLVVLAMKSLRQFVYLSFTLLSLKIVWILIIVILLLTYVKKFVRPSNTTKK